MIEAPQLNSGFLIGTILSLVFIVAYPLVLAVIAHRKLHVGWRYFAYGAIVFFVFQLATRVPAVQLIQAALADQLKASPTLTWAWLAVLALTARAGSASPRTRSADVGSRDSRVNAKNATNRIWPAISSCQR